VAEWECPDCGGFHRCGRRKSGVSVGASDGVSRLKSGASDPADESARFEHVSKALEPSGSKSRTYNQGYEPGFELFWSIYPLHRSKRKAQIAWRKSIHRASANEINSGASRYRSDPNRLPQYTLYAEGWLNADGWLDDPLPPRISPSANVADVAYRKALEAGA